MKTQKHFQGEIRFLENIYEQLDMGEPLFSAIIKASHDIPKGWADELTYAGQYLTHAQQSGLSRFESLDFLARQTQQPRLRELFQLFIEYEQLGSSLQYNLHQIIEHRILEMYTEIEKRIEQAPYKLMLPLFGCIFSGVWLFLVAALISVMSN